MNPAPKLKGFWAIALCITAVFLSACGQIEVSEAETALATRTLRPTSVLSPAPTKVSPTMELPATDPVSEPTGAPAIPTTSDAPSEPTNTPVTEITPATSSPPSQPVPAPETGIPEIDRVIAIILENDIASRRDLVQFSTSGCTHEMGIGGPPKCLPGQEEGTPVEHFPILGHEGGHKPPEEIDQVLDFHVESFYAAFRHKDEPDFEPTFAPGVYVSVFPTGDADGTNVLVHLNEDGKIVRLDTVDRFMALSLEEELERMVAEWLIGPP